jgi:hypothetical protein
VAGNYTACTDLAIIGGDDVTGNYAGEKQVWLMWGIWCLTAQVVTL